MSDEQRSVGDLVRRLRARAKFLNPRNPERLLLDEAVQCIEHVDRQLHEAMRPVTHAPTVQSAGKVERVEPLDSMADDEKVTL